MREEKAADEIRRSRVNSRYLPGIDLVPSIDVTSDAGRLAACEFILMVCPAQHLRGLVPVLPPAVPVLICAKGIERSTGKLMTEVFEDAAPTTPFGMLSGPSFAADVARGLPCAITVAMKDAGQAKAMAEAIGTPSFRPYVSTDITGVAVGGAVKNVLAIACGIVEGRGFGESARAALTARGFAEMVRFGAALGGRHETMAGLSGLGDLILTASSPQSRNFSLGVALARGALPSLVSGALAEGAATAEALVVRARSVGVEMPIADAVADIVAGRVAVDAAIDSLLSRPFKTEA
jgi:glycerol-3-phosphate dehydrogenase (NAD(P)+)